MSFPLITDNNFQDKILTKYKSYQITDKKPKFMDLCFPKSFEYQLPQLFVSKFINPKTPYKGLLVFHKIGAGKTCAAIQIAEQWKDLRNIIFILPASLIGNLYKELRSDCTKNIYITDKERNQLSKLSPLSDEYTILINKINNRIDKIYNIYSYNKYVSLFDDNKLNLNNSLIIIDEVQNIVSESGSYYKKILQSLQKSSSSTRIVLLSATPIFDKPIELALTLNLLKPKNILPIDDFNDIFLKCSNKKYDIKNVELLSELIKGYISYYPGAPDDAFPIKKIKIVKCFMSKFQYDCYKTIVEQEGNSDFKDILKLPNNFFIGSRIISNIAYPNKNINESGFNSLTKTNIKNIERYSIKFYKILNKIRLSKGPNFVYSNFKEYGGLKPFIKILETFGYKNVINHGPGKNRYALWTGDEKMEDKEIIKDIYNKFINKDGSQIKVILGSPSIKEGVSLLRVKAVHILEPYWNVSRLEQIMGRAIRFCSHKDLKKEERIVNIYIYLSCSPRCKNKTVDQYIYNIALEKEILIKKFYDVMKRSSVDYKLFKNASKFIT
jgi:hypothetical protein